MDKVNKTGKPQVATKRMDRLINEEIHDTYKLSEKLTEPTFCRKCGASYHKGRWVWAEQKPAAGKETICSACHRIDDNYPAGEITLSGRFFEQHKEEIINLARNLESVENAEHPLNRIIEIRDSKDSTLITTTDVHLPRRIGTAIRKAFEGNLDIHFDDEGYFTSITWERDT